MNFLAAGALQH